MNQISKSKNSITKTKTLRGICKNNLKNIANWKSTKSEWSHIIKTDVKLTDKVVTAMNKANIFEFNQNWDRIAIFPHILKELEDNQFNISAFKFK